MKKYNKCNTPFKDVDGFHPVNCGMLMTGQAELEPCTPKESFA